MYNLIVQSHHPLQSPKQCIFHPAAEAGDGGVVGAGVHGKGEEAVLAAPQDLTQQGKVQQHGEVPFL